MDKGKEQFLFIFAALIQCYDEEYFFADNSIIIENSLLFAGGKL